MKTPRGLLAPLCLALMCTAVETGRAAEDRHAAPCRNPDYQHGISYVLPLKYTRDFEHFEYANPDAPKMGRIRHPIMGTFDSFNNILERGRVAMGMEYAALQQIHFERLLEPADDEPASAYGRLAEGVAVGPGHRWVAFKLRDNARWHDGEPLTVDDVVFSFEAFKRHGSVALKTALHDLDRVLVIGEREVCFVTREGAEINPSMPFAYGNAPIQARHYWQHRDLSKTTVEPPLGAGPYRLKSFDLGRNLVYERVADYWGRDIPVNRGRFNFDIIKFDYFRDQSVMLEAHKNDVVDVREEPVSKNWATQYDFPAARARVFRKELRHITRVWGLWWPVFWNQERARFQDARVREALYLLLDYPYVNRVMLHGFYKHGNSFFENSPMAQSGLPSEDELALLAPFRASLPARLFTEPFGGPPSDGYGFDRGRIKRALELFEQAGWVVREGRLVRLETGEQFHIDFVFVGAALLRSMMPFIETLHRVGISTTARAPELSHWQHRMRTGAFDGGGYYYVPTNMPGLALRNRFGSASADAEYTQNWAKIRDEVLDHLIEKVIVARTARDFYAAIHAFDRVLLWRFYFIPRSTQPGYRLVYWDRFGEVRTQPLSRVPFLDAWWWDEAKARRVAAWSRSANAQSAHVDGDE